MANPDTEDRRVGCWEQDGEMLDFVGFGVLDGDGVLLDSGDSVYESDVLHEDEDVVNEMLSLGMGTLGRTPHTLMIRALVVARSYLKSIGASVPAPPTGPPTAPSVVVPSGMSPPVPQGSVLILTTELGKAPDFKAALRIWAAHLVTPNPLLPTISPDEYDTMDWCAARALNPGDEGYTYHRTDTATGTNWGFYTTGGQGDDEMGAVLDGVSLILDGVGMMDAAGVVSAVAA